MVLYDVSGIQYSLKDDITNYLHVLKQLVSVQREKLLKKLKRLVCLF